MAEEATRDETMGESLGDNSDEIKSGSGTDSNGDRVEPAQTHAKPAADSDAELAKVETVPAVSMSLLGRSGWSLAANSLTIARIVGAPILCLLVYSKNPWWFTFVFGWLLGSTDWFDGILARKSAPTKAGAFLDPLADKIVVLLLGYTFVVIERFSWIPITLIAVREVLIMAYRSYWGRRGLAIPARRSAKFKTLVQGIALSAALLPPLEPYPIVADLLLWLAVGFTWFSGIQYAIDGRSALRTTGSR